MSVSAEQPFEVREGMEGGHTPETDFTIPHQDLEEGDRFESSYLRLEKLCFLALQVVDTHLCKDSSHPSFMEGTEIALIRICLP